MKTKWDKIWADFEDCNLHLNEFIEDSSLSALQQKKMEQFIRSWNAVKKQISDFDTYISPTTPIDIKIPFKSEKLLEMWKDWKDYLSEQHGKIMRSRSEKYSLEFLKEMCRGDEEKAMKYLRYAMANGYRNFFVIEDKDLKQPAKNDTGSSFD
jgi:hypothetical protein